jgi:hypothetical protein
MYLYLQKVQFGYEQKNLLEKIVFVSVLKVIDEKSRIRIKIRESQVRIRESGSVPKSHGSGTLVKTIL